VPLYKKIRILLLLYLRSPGASLKTKYEAICPYCGKKGEDHKDLFRGSGTTRKWGILNRIYLLSCYNDYEDPCHWNVIRLGKLKFSARSFPRGFGCSKGFSWSISLNE